MNSGVTGLLSGTPSGSFLNLRNRSKGGTTTPKSWAFLLCVKKIPKPNFTSSGFQSCFSITSSANLSASCNASALVSFCVSSISFSWLSLWNWRKGLWCDRTCVGKLQKRSFTLLWSSVKPNGRDKNHQNCIIRHKSEVCFCCATVRLIHCKNNYLCTFSQLNRLCCKCMMII